MTTPPSNNFLERASCVGTASLLWIQTELNDFSVKALEICKACPVRKQCSEWVRPETSYFDGVAAGHIYYNGRLIV